MSKTRGKNKNKTTVRHRRNKNSIQKSRGKHRRKTMKYLGGRAKIKFPYVYCKIDKNTLTNAPANFRQYIKMRMCMCTASGTGTSVEASARNCDTKSSVVTPDDILTGTNSNLILILRYDQSIDVNLNPALLGDQTFLDTQILGHTIVTINDTVACIYDMCSHKPKSGYGKILFNSVMQYIKDTAVTKQCWLAIKLDNVLFDKVASIYVSNGFCDGFITEKDPWGKDMGFKFISLKRESAKDIVNSMTTHIELCKVIQLKNQYIMCLAQNINYSTFLFSFDENCIMHLRLLPFSSHKNTNNVTKRSIEPVKDDFIKSNMRELSGIFNIYNAGTSVKLPALNSLYTLSLTTIAEDASIKYTLAPDDAIFNVVISNNSYTFHTHPLQAYYTLNVLIGPPSAADFAALFGLAFITPWESNTFIVPQFHAVISIEGIYIISLNKEAILNIGAIMTNMDDVIKIVNKDSGHDVTGGGGPPNQNNPNIGFGPRVDPTNPPVVPVPIQPINASPFANTNTNTTPVVPVPIQPINASPFANTNTNTTPVVPVPIQPINAPQFAYRFNTGVPRQVPRQPVSLVSQSVGRALPRPFSDSPTCVRFEYPMSARYNDWNTRENDPTESLVNDAITKYKNWFNVINVLNITDKTTGINLEFPLFSLQLLRWKDLDYKTVIEINCPMLHGNPFVDSKDWDNDYTRKWPLKVDEKFYSSIAEIAKAKQYIQNSTPMPELQTASPPPPDAASSPLDAASSPATDYDSDSSM